MVAALVLILSLAGQAPAETVAAARGLVKARQWEQLDAKFDAVAADDPAWERLAQVVYEAGIQRKDLPAVVARLTRLTAGTPSQAVKASALIVIGRVHRRQGDRDAALQALESARAAAPDTSYAEEAAGLIYEITRLSPGLPAPPIATIARDGRPFNLASLRGKAVVLVFWGTT